MRDLGLYKIAQKYVELFPDKMTWEKAEEMLGIIELVEDSYDVSFASYFVVNGYQSPAKVSDLMLIIYKGQSYPIEPLKSLTSNIENVFDDLGKLLYMFLTGENEPIEIVKPDKMDYELRRIKMINQLKGNMPPIKIENIPQVFVLDALWQNILI